MNSAFKILPHYTYEDYCLWEGRWEIIEGIPYAMSPAPNPRHQILVMTIGAEFLNALRKNNCKHCKVYDFIDVKIEEDTIVQPDVSIVCKPIAKNFLDFPATLVVEILSPATALKDRHTKYGLYEKMGIKYFLIVSFETQTIEIFSLQNGRYQPEIFNANNLHTFILEDDCRIEVDFNAIWE